MFQERFDRYVAILKGEAPAGSFTPQDAADEAWYFFWIERPKLRPYALKIMESGIFHRGGLSALQDGHVLTGGKSHYPIEDLLGFVSELTLLFYGQLERFARDNFLEEVKQRWARLREELDFFCICIKLRIAAGNQMTARKQKEVDRVRERLEEWGREYMAELEQTRHLPESLRLKEVKTILREWALKIFTKNLPGVPKDTISRRCAELLTMLGIPTKKETLRKTLTRHRA